MTATANDWTQIEPLLDDAMAALDETDRSAILLRYFENKSLHEVGETLGASEDAAQKRVSRAVEKLREFFSKQKITVGASGLVVLISANAVQAAPVGLSAAILTATSGTTATVGITMIHKFLIAGFAAAAIGSGIYSIHVQKEISALQQEQMSLNQQIAQLSSERDDARSQLTALQQENERLRGSENELLKLRGENGVLRRQVAELGEKNHALQNAKVAPIGSDANSPQIHVKARFLTIPKDVLLGLGGLTSFNGILTSENASNVLHEVELRNGVGILAEPEVVTTSGRQFEMRATQVISVITNFCLQETNGISSIVPQAASVETGPVLDAMPRILSDGHTIELAVVASLMDFLGYASSTNTTPAFTAAGQEVDVPTVSPQFRVQQATKSVNLLDGQTIVLPLNDNLVPPDPDATFLKPDGNVTKYKDKKTLVFITATIVDPTGNRIHSDEESFSNTSSSPAAQ